VGLAKARPYCRAESKNGDGGFRSAIMTIVGEILRRRQAKDERAEAEEKGTKEIDKKTER
jgi:hypothetical protein